MKPQTASPTELYLRKEIQDLKYQVQELQQVLECNKEALRNTLRPDSCDIKEVVRLLYKQNDLLRQALGRHHQEISNINSTMLIGQQIVIATESHERKLIEDLRSASQELKLELREKEKRIVQLERCKLVMDSQSHMYVKTVFVTTPSLLQMTLHDNLEIINSRLKVKENELERQKAKNQDLFRLNLILNKQLLNAKLCSTGIKSGNSGNKKSDYQEILENHQKLRRSQESSSYHSSDRSDPELVISLPKKRVPILELSKAKQIQQIIVSKINRQKKSVSKKQVLRLATKEQMLVQKELQEGKLKCLIYERKIAKMGRIIAELQHRNSLLISTRNRQQSNNYDQYSPSREQLHQREIGSMLSMAKDVCLNDALDKVVRGEVQPSYKDGSLSS